MSYFKATSCQCAHYPHDWSRVLNQIKGWDSSYSISREISQPLEAKALYVCTMARRLTRAAHWLSERVNGWKPVFLEAAVLLFPMIELVGYARVDHNQVKSIFDPKNKKKDDVSAVNLWAGLHWLRDPNWLPVVQRKNQRDDPTLLSKWQIGHLVSLRHYLLHGSKQVSHKGGPVPIDDIISYELPEYVVTRVQETLPDYWRQLKEDDGSQRWVERLAQADIRPLKLQGSGFYEEGLVDPDIVDLLEGNARFFS
ncbi:MAG: hypothetical protein H8E47_00395 [Anaerolineales bacterium]|nr:hypothetical protein [Anaerolineales bacterium]